MLFAGDDLGDLDAFEAVAELRERGGPTLLVCSLSEEENALAEHADVIVKGPEGVLELLREITAARRLTRPPRHRRHPPSGTADAW